MVDLSLTSCQDTVTCDPEIVIFSGKHIPNIACDPRIIAGNHPGDKNSARPLVITSEI